VYSPALHSILTDTFRYHAELDFISSYHELANKNDVSVNAIKRNRSEQAALTQEIEAKQKKLYELQEHEKRLQAEQMQGKNEKKRLWESLSQRDRALFKFGLQVAREGNKRIKFSDEEPSKGGDEE
jgi:predicted DNA-binding protein YlxM (UPF0122 family)